jgi:hypothetical protein
MPLGLRVGNRISSVAHSVDLYRKGRS